LDPSRALDQPLYNISTPESHNTTPSYKEQWQSRWKRNFKTARFSFIKTC